MSKSELRSCNTECCRNEQYFDEGRHAPARVDAGGVLAGHADQIQRRVAGAANFAEVHGVAQSLAEQLHLVVAIGLAGAGAAVLSQVEPPAAGQG